MNKLDQPAEHKLLSNICGQVGILRVVDSCRGLKQYMVNNNLSLQYV